MKKTWKMLLCSLLIVPAAIILTACGNTKVEVESVTLNKNELNVTTNEAVTLTATVLPENATNKDVTWTSSNEEVVTVQDGILTFVGEGSAVITVTTKDGNKTATCNVLYEVPYVAAIVKESGSVTKYNNFVEAVNASESGDTIKLGANVVLENPLGITKNLTFDGQGKYSIKAGENFVNYVVVNEENKIRPMIYVMASSGVTDLTFKNLTLDAQLKARVLEVQTGKTILNGVTVTGGKVTDNDFSYAAGVFFTHASTGEIINSKIFGCVNESYVNDDYMQYTSDLWIGANAKVTIKEGSEVANAFLNANSYSATNKGALTVEGGKITNVFIEYYANYGADLKFVNGTITNLKVATTSADGTYEAVTAETGFIYTGGGAKTAIA